MPEPVQTVADLISVLQRLNPQMPVLVESCDGDGCDVAAVEVLVMQELDGHGGHGRYQFPTEADRLMSRRNAWQVRESGPLPTRVGEVFAAVVIHRRTTP